MKPVPFDPQADLAPIPFAQRQLHLARELKQKGLAWHPHVGCFVWDEGGNIEVASPFPYNVYYILSLPRFVDIFGSLEEIEAHLIWVPTWHQARLACRDLGIADSAVVQLWHIPGELAPGEEECRLYQLLLNHLS